MDAMWTLCNPLMRTLMARVQARDIGTPRASAAVPGPIGLPPGHGVDDPALGGSHILDCPVYPLNILAVLASGLLKDATLTASSVKSARGVDSSAAIQLVSPQGLAAMSGGLAAGAQGAGPKGFQLIGDAGWLSPTICSTPAGRCFREGLTEGPLMPQALTLQVLQVMDQALLQTRGKVLS
jgi:hypothetical protein